MTTISRNICTIYVITNTVNGLVYVGQTWDTIEYRFRSHCNSRCAGIDADIKQYGRENFSIVAIASGRTQSDADFLETHLIAFYESMDPSIGYNRTTGGQGGKKSEETKRRISASKKGKPSKCRFSPEKEEAIIRAYVSGKLYSVICEELDISHNAVSQVLIRNNIHRNRPSGRSFSAAKEQSIVEAYIDGISYAEISKTLNVDESSIAEVAKRHGLPKRSRKKPRMSADKEKAIVAAYVSGDTYLSITRSLHVSDASIIRVVLKYGLPRRN